MSAVNYSCGKKEPAEQPDPNEIMQKITEQYLNSSGIDYYRSGKNANSVSETKELSGEKATELYSRDKNKPVDLSKIEKYSISIIDADSDGEVGIFKLYDKAGANYVKEMTQTRIAKMQDKNPGGLFSGAEARSYGNYVYYVSHLKKDEIFELIENKLKGV